MTTSDPGGDFEISWRGEFSRLTQTEFSMAAAALIAELELPNLVMLATAYRMIAKDLRDLPETYWDDPALFAKLLNTAFNEFGISQEEMAKALRYSPPTISRWKAGDNVPPKVVRPLIVKWIADEIEKKASITQSHADCVLVKVPKSNVTAPFKSNRRLVNGKEESGRDSPRPRPRQKA